MAPQRAGARLLQRERQDLPVALKALLLFRAVSVLFRMSRSSREVRAKLEELKVKLGAQRAKEKNTFGGMFKSETCLCNLCDLN